MSASAARPYRWVRRPQGASPRMEFGADYNPEQWPREVWSQDIELMREAGVTIVSLGIFSWAKLAPAEDTWDFEWLDEVMDLLHTAGIGVDLATATASPPPWLSIAYPETLPVNAEGARLWHGGRQHWRPTSPIFRRHALRLVRALAERYRHHPALVAWHVNNELGCHNVFDYSDDAAQAFREWLHQRYGSIEGLNDAWGTAFWSQRYSDFAEVIPPRVGTAIPNPTQQLDFRRFSSDALKDHLRAERAILDSLTPEVPVTTNFMVVGHSKDMDYADWSHEVDFVANDHYTHPGERARDELAFSANLTGNMAKGRPWFLMEHSTSAVNWQPINIRKRPGALARDSLTHVAHGADAVCFFQWRQSAAGAEKYHSAMVPHAGRDSRLFRDVVDLGQRLQALHTVAGSHRKPADVAIVVDYPSWWAVEADSHPTELLRYRQEAENWHTALLDLGIRADIMPADGAWERASLVIAPVLHMVPKELADRMNSYVAGGGHLVATYFTGTVDENDHVHLGGYPGILRDLLGVRVEEFAPLLAGEQVRLSPLQASGESVAATSGPDAQPLVGTVWSEDVEADPATEVLSRYVGGDLDGSAAVTRLAHPGAAGSAAYVSTQLAPHDLGHVARVLAQQAGVSSELPAELRGLVELAIRAGESHEHWFLINRTDHEVDLAPLETGRLAPRGVEVISR